MESRYRETLSVAEQAAEWLLIMESPRPEQRAAFWEWMDRSPLHVRELLLAARVRQMLKAVDREHGLDVQGLVENARSNVTQLGERERLHRPVNLHARRRIRMHRMAACAAALIVVVGVLLATWNGRQSYSTQIGEQRVLALADGSTVYLNTRSRIKVRYSAQARDIYLPEGQALFDVRRDVGRPFRVHTESSVVEAVGTQFDVRVLEEQTIVSVVEGLVDVLPHDAEIAGRPRIEAPGAARVGATRVAAGEAATIDVAGEILRTSRVDVAAVAAWKQQRLVFNGETLAWICHEFNRYNAEPQLRVDGDVLRSRRFNGVFDARSPESLLEYLAQDASIALERRGSEVLIREADAPRSTPDETSAP